MIPQPKRDVVLHEMPDGEHALADTSVGRMLIVNDLGAAIWLMMDGHRDVGAICEAIAEAKATPAATVTADVEAFVAQLRDHGFIS